MIVTFDSKQSKTSSDKIAGGLPDIASPLSSSLSPLPYRINGSPIEALTSPGSIIAPKMVKNHQLTKRSKNGCLTCKVRKKKCKENRPKCLDCERLNKDCIWIDHDTMSEEEIKFLKEKVEKEESVSKLRKRKSKVKEIEVKKHKKDNLNDSVYNSLISQETEPSTLQTNVHDRGILITKKTTSSPHVLKQSGQFPSPEAFVMSPRLSPFMAPNSPTISSLMNPIDSAEVPAKKSNKQEDSPPPLDLDFSLDKSPGSPQAFLSFLRDLSQYQHLQQMADHKITLINDENNNEETDYQHFIKTISENSDIGKDQHEHSLDSPIALSPNFNINSLLESISSSSHSPNAINHLASNFNAFFHPIPQNSPSLLPDLSETGGYLYNYYVDTLSRKISIAPTSQNESNSYQKVFLPLAHKDKGVLYGILAWSGFHLGGDWHKEGAKYINMALDHIKQTLTDLRERRALAGAEATLKDTRQSIINKLATLLILCGAEICRGDVKNWTVYLSWGWKILYSNGGILNFNSNKEEHWLISNFAYHDLLASSTCVRGTYFPSNTYDIIFNDTDKISKGNLSPILGISKKLYRIIGDINTLVSESKKIFDDYYNTNIIDHDNSMGVSQSPTYSINNDDDENDDTDSQISSRAKVSRKLFDVITKAKYLERQIDEAKPDPSDISSLTDEDLNLQLTLFESFQISAKLFVRQALLKCNPSALESQVLTNDLTKCIDILIDSPAQASLVFPIFMAGIHCVTEHDRIIMKQRIETFVTLYGAWSIKRIRHILDIVWDRNPKGDLVVDWMAILNDLNWEINFA